MHEKEVAFLPYMGGGGFPEECSDNQIEPFPRLHQPQHPQHAQEAKYAKEGDVHLVCQMQLLKPHLA